MNNFFILKDLDKKAHFRPVILFKFKKGSSAAHTFKSNYAVYGNGAVSKTTCQKWFKRCRDGNFSLFDEPSLGQPSKVNEDCGEVSSSLDRLWECQSQWYMII